MSRNSVCTTYITFVSVNNSPAVYPSWGPINETYFSKFFLLQTISPLVTTEKSVSCSLIIIFPSCCRATLKQRVVKFKFQFHRSTNNTTTTIIMKYLALLALLVVAVLVAVCESASVPSVKRENGIAKANSLERFEKIIGEKKDCTCMNWRFCDGEINSE